MTTTHKPCGHALTMPCGCITRPEPDDEPIFSPAERTEIAAYVREHWHDEPEPEARTEPSADEAELREQIAETAKSQDDPVEFLSSLATYCRTQARGFRPRRRR